MDTPGPSPGETPGQKSVGEGRSLYFFIILQRFYNTRITDLNILLYDGYKYRIHKGEKT